MAVETFSIRAGLRRRDEFRRRLRDRVPGALSATNGTEIDITRPLIVKRFHTAYAAGLRSNYRVFLSCFGGSGGGGREGVRL